MISLASWVALPSPSPPSDAWEKEGGGGRGQSEMALQGAWVVSWADGSWGAQPGRNCLPPPASSAALELLPAVGLLLHSDVHLARALGGGVGRPLRVVGWPRVATVWVVSGERFPVLSDIRTKLD